MPVLRPAIEDGTAAGTLLDGLDGTKETLLRGFAQRSAGRLVGESMAGISLALVAADGLDRLAGALSVTAPATIPKGKARECSRSGSWRT
ncbi:hypothetical protein OG978_44680 (plasmid) [Streptomyces sp. NBC_01591]|uniref:hypothetical protein n=1 Tax=Streptomyces sp. NBC_01591 TaxID=2975888 RepID=UPI002DD92520|nr:hypothetical protein [Streptomyces sp. NBC_01591]WSD74209.1 hypothetical protein OG978_44680 [Streptomyces sp. NBC_01591]